jgi:hypothetical protein
MTETTARKRVGILAWMPASIGRRQRELSDRVHAAGDECARLHGWEVTKSTGRFGFGARTYRDPRFDDRRRQFLPPEAAATPIARQYRLRRRPRSATRRGHRPPGVKSTAYAAARADQRAVHAQRERKCDGG